MGDKLYVPVHQADRLSRYVGAGEHGPPMMHRLGTADWGLVKKRAKKAVEDIADDLLQLYAARELAEGGLTEQLQQSGVPLSTCV